MVEINQDKDTGDEGTWVVSATQHSRANRRWRDYRTAGGQRPVRKFIKDLTDEEAAAVTAAMSDVRMHGNVNAHHLQGEIYEVIASSRNKAFRILYASEGKEDQVLLALHAITKKTRAVPRQAIQLAERRLRDWRSRSREAAS